MAVWLQQIDDSDEIVESYINKLLDIVKMYSGDVIKFLGDAILVAFASENSSDSSQLIALKAAVCCLHCLKEHSVHQVNLNVMYGNIMRGKLPSMENAKNFEDYTNMQLSIHVAVVLGDFKHVITGSSDKRHEYFIFGEALDELSTLLNDTAAGIIKTVCICSNHIFFQGEIAFSASISSHLKFFLPNLDSALGKYVILQQQRQRVVFPTLFELYCENFGIPEAKDPTNEYFSYSTLPGQLMINDERLSQKDEMIACFVNRAILSQLDERSFRSDYRRVSVLFVKLHGEFDARVAASAVDIFVEVVHAFDGIFQQFSGKLIPKDAA
ncbi:hypothetical protein HDU97_000098 [Phlyctochytrium planicorne]|nr:hypothetical protein HDU97_000098 [Phlyctochytrium planicorne]